jgi:trehalose-6-phosphatase
MQAKELISQLQNLFEHLPIEVVEIGTSVHVMPRELKKEKVIKTMIENVIASKSSNGRSSNLIDFVFYIGEYAQAEKVFRFLN